MTPDPRTEEIRARMAAARPVQLFTGTSTPGLWLDADSVDYLLGRIEALEGVADAIRSLHRPVRLIFSWNSGLRMEEPCSTCHGKAGVHECGCWQDEDTTYECAECTGKTGKREIVVWPCPTAAALAALDGGDGE